MNKLEALSSVFHREYTNDHPSMTWLQYKLKVLAAISEMQEGDMVEFCAMVEVWHRFGNEVKQ